MNLILGLCASTVVLLCVTHAILIDYRPDSIMHFVVYTLQVVLIVWHVKRKI